MRVDVRGWLPNILLLVVSVSIGLAAFELFLVYDDWHPKAIDFTTEVTLNGTSYRFIEDRRAVDEAGTAVLIAGDSFTAGSSCADGRNYPAAFTRTAVREGANLHAVNMGLQGTAPISYARRIDDYLTEKKTAAGAILTLYANDAEIDCEACRQLKRWSHLGGLTEADRVELEKLCAACLQASEQRVSGDVSLTRRINWWLADHSKTFLLLREVGAKLAVGAGLLNLQWGRAAFPDRWRDVNGLYFKQVRAGIELAREATDRHSIPLMVVIYPDPVGLTRRNDYVAIYQQAQETLSRETGVPVYSGYDAFLDNGRARENMPFSLTDTHPSCEAHAIFGEWAYHKWASVAGLPARAGAAR